MHDPIVAYLIQLDAATTQLVRVCAAINQGQRHSGLFAPVLTAVVQLARLTPPRGLERLHTDAQRVTRDWRILVSLVINGADPTRIADVRRRAAEHQQMFLYELNRVQHWFAVITG